jgi:hypothetical protein
MTQQTPEDIDRTIELARMLRDPFLAYTCEEIDDEGVA